MTEPTSSSPFINSANRQMYGKIPLQSWVGKVVSYEEQKEQLDGGWGWRYKVRILGDNSDVDQVEGGELSYALCILPTTAGSGAAFKLRSVRVSQGDMVYGVFGGDGPRIILGVFPRTSKSSASAGKFGTLSGFYGSLKKNNTLDGEFNEQIGPKTPNTDPVGPKNYNKAEKKEPSDKAKDLGAVAGGNEEVDIEKLTPPVKVQTSEDYNESVQKGEIVVKNEKTLENVTEGGLNGDIDPIVAIVANKTAVKENVIEESVAKENIKQLEEKKDKFKGEKMVEVKNPKGEIILLPQKVVEAGFSFQSQLDEEAEQFEVGGSRYNEVHSSDSKSKEIFTSSSSINVIYSSDDSESEETFTRTSNVNVTYDEDTNTFTRSSGSTTVQTISGRVVGSEKPKTDTDIKLRLIQNRLTVNRFIRLYEKVNAKEKLETAKRHLSELNAIISSDPTTYDGSSLQGELKSSYSGIFY